MSPPLPDTLFGKLFCKAFINTLRAKAQASHLCARALDAGSGTYTPTRDSAHFTARSVCERGCALCADGGGAWIMSGVMLMGWGRGS